MARRRLEVMIVGDTKGLDRAYDRANRSTKRFGVSVGALGKAGLVGSGDTADRRLGCHPSPRAVRRLKPWDRVRCFAVYTHRRPVVLRFGYVLADVAAEAGPSGSAKAKPSSPGRTIKSEVFAT